ncbi:MAG: DUF4876 domain-containing protein [Acidobacteriota bacterium]
MKRLLLCISLMMLILAQGCSEKPPVVADGNSKMIIRAFWNSSTDSNPNYIPMANAKVILSSEYGLMVKTTDINGVVELDGLPCTAYNVSVRMRNPIDASIVYAGTRLSIETSTEKTEIDTIYAKPVVNSGIVINELYVGGPVNSDFYFYDQFIELYNSSDSVKYLDGMTIMRFTGNSISEGYKGPGADEGNDGDIDGATYVFKFPGKYGEKNYPMLPMSFLVLAQNAINHRKFYSSSVDLSNADWEFYNQYSAKDLDNPNVPNLINMRPDKTADFIMSLTNDVIIVASGKDENWQDGIDISTILDGVEYNFSRRQMKTLDRRVENTFSLSPPAYQGHSMQRREAGVDTDEGSLDWEIIPRPTPGYQ